MTSKESRGRNERKRRKGEEFGRDAVGKEEG